MHLDRVAEIFKLKEKDVETIRKLIDNEIYSM